MLEELAQLNRHKVHFEELTFKVPVEEYFKQRGEVFVAEEKW
jgi:hypothetical protein